MPQDLNPLGKGLHCGCGFYTSDAAYMLLHLKESGDCNWNDEQRAMVRREIIGLEGRLTAARQTVTYTTLEIAYLERIFQHKAMPLVVKRLCRVCGNVTKEFLGDSPECSRHRREDGIRDKQGRTKSDILAEFLAE